jgi:hypothetical protein
MENAIAERFACTSHPEKQPRTKDDDEDDWDLLTSVRK